MKAFVISSDCCEASILVWAGYPSRAKILAFHTDTFGNEEWTNLRCRREPRADGLHAVERIVGDHPSVDEGKLLRSLGWHQCEGNRIPCEKCELYEWDKLPESKITDDDMGWICQSCRDNATAHRESCEADGCNPFWGFVTQTKDGLWYRCDFCAPDDTPEEMYADTQEMLREMGWEIKESEIEHDCISGIIVRYNKEITEQKPNRLCTRCAGHGLVDIQSGPYERQCPDCGGAGRINATAQREFVGADGCREGGSE
jgi:hypothetical protein